MSKKNKIFLLKSLLFFSLTPFLFVSCLDTDDDSSATTSDVARITAFSFRAVDSLPGLALASFKVEERLDTGLIYNQDSILFATPVNKVVPSISYAATPGSVIMHYSNPDTTFYLTGSDTLDFTRQPLYLSVRSSDGTNTKVYQIVVKVHQTDPDLFCWNCLTPAIYTPGPGGVEQQAFHMNNTFYLLVNNGFENRLYSSADGAIWSQSATPVALPSACHVRSIVNDENHAYYVDSTTLYIASDPVSWQAVKQTGSLTPITMLMMFNDSAWAIVEKEDELYLATLGSDNQLRISGYCQPLPSDFPVSNAATVVFAAASTRARAALIGGFSKEGKSLNSRWNIEYSRTFGYRLVNFSIEKPIFQSIIGAGLVWYDQTLFLFGGVDDKGQYKDPILFSVDEGVNWEVPDSTHNQLPSSLGRRQKQSVFVYDNNIFLIGGEWLNTTYTDVYSGRINSIDWEKRD